MKRLLALVLVAGCATSLASQPGERVAGCWISRDAATGAATTMRWVADDRRAGALRGDKLAYVAGGASEAEHYRLEPRGRDWALCQIEAGGERCWQVAQAEEGSLEGGRAFIDAHREDLRISIVGDGAERVVFEGDRDGCD
jgi:hypothetical protein